jgi:hypothetical protein
MSTREVENSEKKYTNIAGGRYPAAVSPSEYVKTI